VPDERAGERPLAVVVAAGEVEADEIVAHVAGRVAPHKRITEVAFVDAIPVSPSGKILRRLLVAQQRAGALVTGERVAGPAERPAVAR
jgi:acyl-CoA synthetase (AMP-forming)/AMP-acid ligase II